ncbi:hypothetical protein FD723_40715 (plasmid) [Nostoc sp. C052]|uniref:hypothetical protein n=1 Tax=Nostoc sp. C052 TaxID=2576902 RepID=UPI0015C2F65F|nr:hypothetical protein [Nostoc sp. C052]QLE46538.1 hypothetical protein FD723_40715 [Nostoc sp. C052]
MQLRQELLKEYESLYAMSDVSVGHIERLSKMLNNLCEKEGFLSIEYCKLTLPMLFYWYAESKFWDIQEHELAIASLKNQIFDENGKFSNAKLPTDVKGNYKEDRAWQVMFNADKLQFAGFMHIAVDNVNKTTHYVVAVYRLTGINGNAHFCINQNVGDAGMLQFLALQRFTPQDVVCKKCEYFLKESIAENRLLCGVHPDGPTLGYKGCADFKLIQHQQS